MTCVLCNQDMKFVNHIFVSCPYTVTISIWSLSLWPVLTAFLGTLSPSNIMKFFIFPQCHLKIPTNEVHKFTLFASILFDKIWRIQNQTIFAGHTPNPKEGVEMFKVYFDHILAWSQLYLSPPPLLLIWKPPHTGWVKIKFDVAIRTMPLLLQQFARMNLVRFCLPTHHSMFLYDNSSSK